MRCAYALILLSLFAGSDHAQIATFGCNGHGLGHSPLFSIDCDGDGYGVGPNAIINTTAGGSVSVGSQTVTPASMTSTITATTNSTNQLCGILDTRALQVGETVAGSGIPGGTTITVINPSPAFSYNFCVTLSASATTSVSGGTFTIGIGIGTVIRYDVAQNMERVVVSSVASTTFTGTFLVAHASGVQILDQGVIGPDADDNDPLVWTASQATTKYGSLTAFLTKLGNDIIVENPFCGEYLSASSACQNGLTFTASEAMSQAVAITLSNPVQTLYLAPSTASPAGNDSNGSSLHCVITAPCLTNTGLIAAGYTTGGGYLILVRQGWNTPVNGLTMFAGASTKDTILMSYPGEQAIIDANVVSGAKIQILDTAYVAVVGLRLQYGAVINGGTTDGNSVDSEQDFIARNDTTDGATGDGNIEAFNGLNNWVLEDNVLSNNSFMHGAYLGGRNYISTQLVFRRNLIYGNAWNGLHWNGRCTYCIASQNATDNNDLDGISLQQGWSHGFVESNLSFQNQRGFLQFYDADMYCGDASQGNLQYACPYDQNFNLVANNTDYTTLASYNSITVASDTTGCVYSASTCPSPTLQGDLGHNTYVNNILIGPGNPGATIAYTNPPIYFATCISGTSNYFNGAGYTWTGPCLFNASDTFLPTSTFTNDLVWENGPDTDTNVVGWGPATNLGAHYTSHAQTQGTYYGLTCTTLASTATSTGCINAAPGFIAATTSTNIPNFDFRLGSSAAALHAGSLTGVSPYDLAGRAFLDDTPSIGALERNLWATGWNALSACSGGQGCGYTTAVVPPNGAPLDALAAAITSTSQTTFTFTTGAPYAQVGNLALINNGANNELVCISSVSGATIVVGNVASCDSGAGCATATAGRGCHSTTAATFATSGTTIYYNVVNPSGVQATTPSGVFPFQTQYTQANGGGAGRAAFVRDIPGTVKQICWWGGGHSDYIGNEVPCISFNRATPLIANLNNPSTLSWTGYDVVGSFNFVASGGSQYVLPAELKDGSANPPHILGNVAYAPWNDTFYKFGGGYSVGNGYHSYDTNSFNVSSLSWFRFTGASGGTDTDCGNYGTGFTSCSYSLGHQVDPVGDYTPGTAGFSGLAVSDPVTRTIIEWWNFGGVTQWFPSVYQHVLRATSFPATQCCSSLNTYGSSATLVSDQRFIFATVLTAGSLGAYKAPLTGLTSTTPTSSPNLTESTVTPDASCTTPLTSPGPGLAFIPAVGKILVYQANAGGNTYYLMDPTSFVCTSFSPSGGPPAGPSNPYPLMKYSPATDATVLVDDVGANVPRVLSLNAPDPAGTAVCGITPTSLPGGTVGVAYSQVLTNANCSASTWSITSGSLPAGLSGCNSGSGTTCTISGTPTGAGTSTFTANYSTAANPLSITIAAGVTVKGISAGNGIMTGIQ